MTNYERIKEMSVEEMAGKLRWSSLGCKCCIYDPNECTRHDKMTCKDGISEWLNSEVEE